MAARYGGEELAIVLPGAGPDRAWTVAERLRSALAVAPTSAPVTASVGVATLPDDALDHEDLLEKADQGLYKAKRNGRNRVARPPAKRATRQRSADAHPAGSQAPVGPAGVTLEADDDLPATFAGEEGHGPEKGAQPAGA